MSETTAKVSQISAAKGGRPKKRLTDPPSDLDAESKRFWRRTLAQLQGQGTWEDSDVPMLERYVRKIEQARTSRAKIPADGTTKGSQGQLVEHPAIKTVREAERDAQRYAEALILTPASRKRYEIEAKKADESELDKLLG